MRPPAIGYLRRDVSGVSTAWDEIQIRTLTRRLGYELTKTIAFSDMTADPIGQLIAAIGKAEAEAVVVPSAEHFGGEIPKALVRVVDVITVSPEETYARRIPSPFA